MDRVLGRGGRAAIGAAVLLGGGSAATTLANFGEPPETFQIHMMLLGAFLVTASLLVLELRRDGAGPGRVKKNGSGLLHVRTLLALRATPTRAEAEPPLPSVTGRRLGVTGRSIQLVARCGRRPDGSSPTEKNGTLASDNYLYQPPAVPDQGQRGPSKKILKLHWLLEQARQSPTVRKKNLHHLKSCMRPVVQVDRG
jgi:hypothetical protein